ncbi:hypothetical protein C1I59_07450 [Paenibacillus polymyxa]|nr:hypothetical protein C1I59_07450 [Paenibacillus polymyxa]
MMVKSFAEYIGNRSAILDLDIDAFNNSDTIGESDFISEETIRGYIKGLKDFVSMGFDNNFHFARLFWWNHRGIVFVKYSFE